MSIALIVPVALLLSGACQLPGLKTMPPTSDELEQLETNLARTDIALGEVAEHLEMLLVRDTDPATAVLELHVIRSTSENLPAI